MLSVQFTHGAGSLCYGRTGIQCYNKLFVTVQGCFVWRCYCTVHAHSGTVSLTRLFVPHPRLPHGPESLLFTYLRGTHGMQAISDRPGVSDTLLLFTGWYRPRRPMHCNQYCSVVLPRLSSNYSSFTHQSALAATNRDAL
jgi:hypothetical protein